MKERERLRYHDFYESGYETEYSMLRRKLHELFEKHGFCEDHQRFINNLDFSDLKRFAAVVNDQNLPFLAKALPYGRVRNTVCSPDARYHEPSYELYHLLKTLAEMAKAFEGDQARQDQAATDFAKLVVCWSRDRATHPKIYSDHITEDLIAGAMVIKNPVIFALCGSDPERLSKVMSRQVARHRDVSWLRDLVKELERKENLEFLHSLKGGSEVIFEFTDDDIHALRKREDLREVVAEHLQTPDQWADTIRSLDKAFCAVGMGEYRAQALDEAVIRNYSRIEAFKIQLKKNPALRGLDPAKAWKALEEIFQIEAVRTRRPITDEFERDSKRIEAALASLTPGERFTLLCGLYKGLGETGTNEVRDDIRMDPEIFGPATSEKIAWLERAADRARRKEHPRNPLITRGIAVSTGYEVEAAHLSDAVNTKLGGWEFFSVTEVLGFHRGIDQFEVSPGPFHDPETGIALFELVLDSGVVSQYLEAGWSFHLNLGLDHEEEMPLVVKPFYLASSGDSFQYSKRRAYDKNLRIYPNDQGKGRYIEGKVFRVITIPDFYWTYRSATYLSWACRAYYRLCTQNNTNWLSHRDMVKCVGGRPEKELAKVWLNFITKLARGANSAGFRGMIEGVKLPWEELGSLHQQQALVYPDMKARHNPLPRDVKPKKSTLFSREPEVVEPIPVKTDGRTWPTIIHFAREVIDEGVQGVQNVVERYEAGLVAQMKRIDATSGRTRKGLIDALFIEAHANVPPKATWAEKEQIYAEIHSIYF